MRKLVLASILVLLLSAWCAAAEGTAAVPKVDIFGGYSLLRVNPGISGVSSFTFNGWDTQVTGNFNRYLGVTADISGEYKSFSPADVGATGTGSAKLNIYSFLFGPTLTYRKGKFEPFVHTLFGVSHGSASASGTITGGGGILGFGTISGSGSSSANEFAMALGGGVDVKVAKMLSIRLGQLDYFRTSFASDTQNNFRYSAGVVLHLGGQ